MEIALSPDDRAFLDRLVADGAFASLDDAVAAGIGRLRVAAPHHGGDASAQWSDEEFEAILRPGIDDIESGRSVTATTPADLHAVFEEIRERGRQRLDERRRAESA